MNKPTLKEKMQKVIEESLGAEVSFEEETITILRQVKGEGDELTAFVEEYLELLADLSFMHAGSRKVVVTFFSVQEDGESIAKFVAEEIRENEEELRVVSHSYTCDNITGVNSKLSTVALRALGEEFVTGIDVDVRAQNKKG